MNTQQCDMLKNSSVSTVKLFGNDKLSGTNFCLLDSRASPHITGLRHCLFNIVYVSSCFIGLPKGSLSISIMEESVHLGQNFILDRVLFVPDLKCNLMSIS